MPLLCPPPSLQTFQTARGCLGLSVRLEKREKIVFSQPAEFRARAGKDLIRLCRPDVSAKLATPLSGVPFQPSMKGAVLSHFTVWGKNMSRNKQTFKMSHASYAMQVYIILDLE